jgi:RND family efflux transporter MFP subunit
VTAMILRTSTRIKVVIATAMIVAMGYFATWYLRAAPTPNPPTPTDSRPSVEVVSPRRATVAQRLQSNATLEAFEDANLFAKVSGYLSEVRVDIGDHVKAGQILAVIDVPEMEKELAEAEAQLAARQKSLETARRQLDRTKADLALQEVTLKRQESLHKDRWVSDQQLDEIRAKREISRADLGVADANQQLAAAQVDLATASLAKAAVLLEYSKIKAPFDGLIAQRLVNRGDLVQAATGSRAVALFKIQRIDTIRVFCDVPENEVPYVRVGDRATVKPFGLAASPIVGTITRFAFRLDPETRNMRTEIDLPNPDERLYPGMYAEVSLEMDQHPDALTVPTSAIGSDANGNFVYTIKGDRVERAAVKVGIRDSGRVEVTQGLSEQTAVVVTAKRAPPAGTAVQVSTVADKS